MFMREDMDAVSKERSRTEISLRARREEATTKVALCRANRRRRRVCGGGAGHFILGVS